MSDKSFIVSDKDKPLPGPWSSGGVNDAPLPDPWGSKEADDTPLPGPWSSKEADDTPLPGPWSSKEADDTPLPDPWSEEAGDQSRNEPQESAEDYDWGDWYEIDEGIYESMPGPAGDFLGSSPEENVNEKIVTNNEKVSSKSSINEKVEKMPAHLLAKYLTSRNALAAAFIMGEVLGQRGGVGFKRLKYLARR